MFNINTAPNVKLWNTDAEFTEEELKVMRRSVAGITKIAEKCMHANGVAYESCVAEAQDHAIK